MLVPFKITSIETAVNMSVPQRGVHALSNKLLPKESPNSPDVERLKIYKPDTYYFISNVSFKPIISSASWHALQEVARFLFRGITTKTAYVLCKECVMPAKVNVFPTA